MLDVRRSALEWARLCSLVIIIADRRLCFDGESSIRRFHAAIRLIRV